MLFMKDPKKLATMIMENAKLSKKPETSDGAEKDAKPANNDQASRLLEAFKSSDSESVMNILRSFVQTVVSESKDEKPSVPTESV